tara:strand:- start:1192 stop:2055 length:864 start_codon:yes stop_codon:yes gene_type:complete
MKKQNNKKYKVPEEVILSGGNFATVCFLGAIQALIDNKKIDLTKVKKWICTSGGSVIALFLAIGYTPKRLLSILKRIPISKISPLNSDKWLGFFDKYGIHDTDKFKWLFSLLMENIGWSPNTTFKELYDKIKVELVFTTYCLNTQSVVLLNYKNNPDLKILDAICMSIAVPFLFYPVKYKNEHYIDAFLVSIHPVEYCSKQNNSISFCLEGKNEYVENINLINYIRIIINSPINKLQNTFLNNYKGKTVNIKCNYKFDASFEMNTETLEFFYNTGYDEITNNKTNFL